MNREFKALVLAESEAHTSSELSAMLGMIADEFWDKGTSFVMYGRTRVRGSSRWAVSEQDADIEDWRTTVDRLIQRVRLVEGAFRALPSSVRVALTMFVTEGNDVFGFGLDKHQVEFLAKIRAEIEMSFVVGGDAPPTASV